MQNNKLQVSYSTNAIGDLRGIWNYTAEVWSEAKAEIYIAKIEAACNEIVQNPGLGRHYDDMPVALLGHRIERHVIFCTIFSPDEIRIVRILHVNMDFKHRIYE